LTENEKTRLQFELSVPLMIENKESIFQFLKFLYQQKCYYILDRKPKKENEKLKKYPKELILQRGVKMLESSDKVRFISFLGRRKKVPYKALFILIIGSDHFFK
jgi:hypothetical protein